MTDQKILRLTGLAGITGALLMFTGDMFLYGGFYSGAEFSEQSRIIMGEIPQLRLMIGGALGPVAAILYVTGFWHVYLALKPGGKTLAAIAFVGFACMMIISGAYHAGFTNVGLVLRAKNVVQEIDLGTLERLIEQSWEFGGFLYNILFVFGTIGTIFFLITVIFRKTSYPKWIILFTPTLLVFAAPLAQYIPTPVGGIIYGGYYNLVFLLFFVVSTVILGKRLNKVEYGKTK